MAAVAIPDGTLRNRQLEIFFEEVEVRILEIQAAMRDARWEPIRSGVSVLAALPGVSQFAGLVAAVWDAMTGTPQREISRDFAYAAYARHELVDPRAL